MPKRTPQKPLRRHGYANRYVDFVPRDPSSDENMAMAEGGSVPPRRSAQRGPLGAAPRLQALKAATPAAAATTSRTR
jgi:hypothetical protein